MADNTTYYTKHQQQNQANNNNNPSKFYSHFLYKALIVTIFLVILPLFPSQAPEFINQTLNTRGWEFLHLIFVGIAVSYGLFSRRNDETEKDNSSNSKFDNAQSYVSRFLQVSSVFDDDADSPSKSDVSNSTSVQTWNNQYYRNEPVVVVAEEQHPAFDQEQRSTGSRIGEKPLLLPIRSLKSRVLDADGNEISKESISSVSASISRTNSNLGSKRFSSKSRNGEFGGLQHQDLEDKIKDNVVLPSPIPWRSRSGRMEMKEAKEETDSPPLYTLPPSMEESEFNRFFRSQVSRSPRSNSTASSPKLSPSPSMSSPKKLSPPPSFSAETQAKSAEDFVRRKSFHRSPPPPPPPPPPFPQLIRKSRSMKPGSSEIGNRDSVGRDFKRSFTSEPKEMNWVGNSSMKKSIRTTRSNDSFAMASKEKEFDDVINSKTEKKFDQAAFKTNRDRVTFMPQPTYMEYPKEEKEEFVEKLVLESDEDLEETEDDLDGAADDNDNDNDDIAGNSFVASTSASTNNEEPNSGNVSDGGPDVDKKADEFIAKFREQIRLQRIESIKKSSGQIHRKASR
ncbi:uncharacterized protein LOC8286613 [Ricinus communis]|uniref:uncharacterized protein LOC8286613 n=1 Tax=Ricinus communis TaxID=3988 RepID=UPI00201A6FDA|nr:uncharacterized protein LOC8286613 [Ricinus communis]